MLIATFKNFNDTLQGEIKGTQMYPSGECYLIELTIDSELQTWAVDTVACTVVEVSDQPLIKVWYESGYQWSVSVEGYDEIVESGVTKSEAVWTAKKLQKELNGKLEIQTLTKKERALAMKDRWEWVHDNGFSTLDCRI